MVDTTCAGKDFPANGQSLRRHRRGAVAVLAAILMVFLMCVLAFAVDLGYVTLTRSQLRRAVDASALAGAGALIDDVAQADSEARLLMGHNPVAGRPLAEDEIDVQVGRWNNATRTFVPDMTEPSAVRVVGTRRNTPLFFARVIGFDSLDVTMHAVAAYQPRDIMLVLDYSASMSWDSQLVSVPQLGMAAVRQSLREIYEDLGSPTYGNMTWEPELITSTNPAVVKAELGLTNVPYPYPGGSWDNYIFEVSRDEDFRDTGYRRKYGYLTLVNYWLKFQAEYAQTPDLWMTRAQPLESMKDSITTFLDFLSRAAEHDRVGLTVYTAADGTALVEHGLTHDFPAIERASRQLQAGHYEYETNIGAGIEIGREELLRTARPEALPLMVLMTDGKPNMPMQDHGNDFAADRHYAMEEAQRAVDAGISIVTISLGADADHQLMGDIAALSTGMHFVVATGRPPEEVRRDLIRAFERIGSFRPLKLVE